MAGLLSITFSCVPQTGIEIFKRSMTATIRPSTHISYSVENFVVVHKINYSGLCVKAVGDILVLGQIGRLKYLQNKVIIYK